MFARYSVLSDGPASYSARGRHFGDRQVRREMAPIMKPGGTGKPLPVSRTLMLAKSTSGELLMPVGEIRRPGEVAILLALGCCWQPPVSPVVCCTCGDWQGWM